MIYVYNHTPTTPQGRGAQYHTPTTPQGGGGQYHTRTTPQGGGANYYYYPPPPTHTGAGNIAPVYPYPLRGEGGTREGCIIYTIINTMQYTVSISHGAANSFLLWGPNQYLHSHFAFHPRMAKMLCKEHKENIHELKTSLPHSQTPNLILAHLFPCKLLCIFTRAAKEAPQCEHYHTRTTHSCS